jgi:hypothetical protein
MPSTTRLICGFLIIAAFAGYALAQSNAADISSQVIAMERQSMEGWLKGDAEPMLSKMDPEITYFHEITGKRLEGIAAVRQMCEPYRGRPLFDSYEMDGPKVRTAGDVSILSYQLVTHNGSTVARWNMTEIYQRKAEGWRVIHMHNSQVPSSRVATSQP